MKSGLFGKQGEALVTGYFRSKGFRVLEKNYRSSFGEIDLIVEKNKTIHFIEVKTRRREDVVALHELVSRQKQWRLSKTADDYLMRKKRTEASCVFDVVLVFWKHYFPRIEWVRDAFWHSRSF